MSEGPGPEAPREEGLLPEHAVSGIVTPEGVAPPPVAPGGEPAVAMPAPIFREPHPNFWWSALWCMVFLTITQTPGAVLALVIILAVAWLAPGALPRTTKGLAGNPVISAALAVAFFVTEALVIAFSWFALRVVVGRDWARRVGLRAPGELHLLLALASFPATVLLANGSVVLLRELARRAGLPGLSVPIMEEMLKVFGTWPWAFAVLVIGVGPGLGEELWCRAFLGRGLVGRYGVVWGVVLTSFFFGVIHVEPVQATMAALLGLWLHFTYLTTRSLWVPILLHFLNNALSVTVIRFEWARSLEEKPELIPGYVYVAAAALLMAVAGALYQSRARLAGDGAWRPAYGGVEHPPEGSGVWVERPAPTVGVAALVALGVLALAGACAWAALR